MKKLTFSIASLVALLFSASVMATGTPPPSKFIEKVRVEVESAAPDDWYTLAKSAQKCIRKGVNWEESLKWIDKSLNVKENAFALMIKGDYYVKNDLPKKAMEAYIKSTELARTDNKGFNAEHVAEAIGKLRKEIY